MSPVADWLAGLAVGLALGIPIGVFLSPLGPLERWIDARRR